ncbi:hypothetical protein GN244_ATG16597 [Phytophthora infestans]|uniref:Uncharacterized protein n=1 Tax=Phytophthora infestans TaxID=4787 RepID=A0A833W6A0_PHYIN|nr:hypothetical protein GN244_ATG16597 [Phytophthora infestans]
MVVETHQQCQYFQNVTHYTECDGFIFFVHPAFTAGHDRLSFRSMSVRVDVGEKSEGCSLV